MSAERARYRLLSCRVFQRELSALGARSRNLIDPEFLELGLHEEPGLLRRTLQGRIDEISAAGDHEAILLGYGLCGAALEGIRASTLPLVLARAHDCCTLLLGSRTAFHEHFGGALSASWSSAGTIEQGSTFFHPSELGVEAGEGEYDELVRRHGEENASYVWDTLHPRSEEAVLRFIELPETAAQGYAALMRRRAEEEGRVFLLIPGSSRLLWALLEGDWDKEEFLVVPPGRRIVGLYDRDKVLGFE